jgi:tetratricopeptide (TPR) repeat protein
MTRYSIISKTVVFITSIVLFSSFTNCAEPMTLENARTHLSLAEKALATEDYASARTELFAATTLATYDLQTLFATAISLIKIGAFKEAVTTLSRILKHSPTNTTVLYNMGYALKSGGWIDEALVYYKQVLALEPENDAAHLALGYAYINKGDFKNGWPQHERYLKKSGKYAPELRALLAHDSLNGTLVTEQNNLASNNNLANNNNLAGKRILLTPEGGLGDTINFIQCAQLLRDRGAYVIASVQKPLVTLMRSCDCVDEVITGIPTTLKYDARISYMSLPAALYLDETTMPQRTPYLFANKKLVEFWDEELNALEKDGRYNHAITTEKQEQTSLDITTEEERACYAEKPIVKGRACHAEALQVRRRVGLCWQADLPHDESRLPVARRSIPLEMLAQLADLPGVTLYSLQTHEHNAACQAPEIAGKIQTFEYAIDTEHGPFMDTAALIMNMDLVISVDTATAHLAAALGKPTWLLLPYTTDWRWIVHRTDSPWHPTMRIFKQQAPFDWQSVIDTVAQTLMLENIPSR